MLFTASECVLLLPSGSSDEVDGMDRQRLNKFAMAVILFVSGICVAVIAHHLMTKTFTEATKAHGTETMRITSPDGKLDALLVEDTSGGAISGVFWYVYVVPKGSAVPEDATKRLFFADELSKGAIAWSKPRLVEIHYDKASIMQFRNISTASENGLEYVELRLVPASEYSLVTPQGGWRADN